MKDLFDNCDFGDLRLNSRIVRTGLWESERESSGNFTPEMYNRYENIAASGVGLIITELFSLYPRDTYSKYALTPNYNRFVREAKDLTDLVHVYDVAIFAQLGFIECNKRLEQNVSVEDLSIEDIRKIQTDFIIAGQKMDFAGFDGIQIALGNNFFLSNFLNPSLNKRQDKYGGNTLNRLRMVLEMVKVLKQNTKLHINCRINAFDETNGGMTVEEAIEIAKLLEKHGVDSLQLTRPHSQLVFTRENKGENPLADAAEKIIDEVEIPVILGGGFNSQNQINSLLNSSNIEYISMQRPFIADPSFLVDWQIKGNGESFCQTCHNCYAKKTSTCHLKPCSPEYYQK
ncbi:NADH-dependent flavin oxidoreductase [Methanobrevibacter sp.]|uniref:oxidoreductase n=1 Tax=Methanobrevibacter sp. TaxID=66852 RepID=UPI0038905C0F